LKTLYFKLRAIGVTWLLRLLPRNQPLVFSGRGSSLELCRQLALLGYTRALIVSDTFLAGSGLLDDILRTLAQAGVKCTVFDGIEPDPNFEQVAAGEAVLTRESCEVVIGIGGGSVLDAAKLIALLHNNPGDLAFYDGIQKAKNPGLPLFAVPTTAGTGSETTPASVITDSATHRKVAVADGKLVPHYVALDPDLTRTLPPRITAATGMDALTHAVESYLSKASTPVTRNLAATATRLIFENLPRAHHNGEDMDARQAMLTASFYAGVAFGRTSVGYAHAIAHQLGRVCGTPHGEANAMVLPQVLEAYGAPVRPALAELARSCGLAAATVSDDAAAGTLVRRITELRREMGMSLEPAGLAADAVPGIVKAAIRETGDLYPVPRYLQPEELGGIVSGLVAAA
jgi:alcohol dehydrogenase class IV